MSEFTRTNNEELYSENKALPLIIRYTNQDVDWHDKNNDFKFNDFVSQISGTKNCFVINKGKNKGGFNRIVFLIENSDYCVTVTPFRDSKSFSNPNFSIEKNVIPEDKNEFKQVSCHFYFVDISEDLFGLLSQIDWLTRHNKISDFISESRNLQVPLKEIQKEFDKAIWNAYIEGLQAINDSKKELCKISQVGKPQKKLFRGRNITSIDIQIDSSSSNEVLKQSIEELFEAKYDSFPNIEFKGKQCSISFDRYQVIPDDILDKIKGIASEYCYITNEKQPKHSISGNISLISDEAELSQITDEIREELKAFGTTIEELNSNEFNFDEDNEIEHLKKIVNTKWSEFATVKITSKVMSHFSANIDLESLKHSIESPNIKIDKHGDFIIIQSRELLNLDSDYLQNYIFDSCRIKIMPKSFNDTIEINDLEKKGNSYYGLIKDITKIRVADIMKHKVKKAYKDNGNSITTEYFYSFRPKIDKNLLAKIRMEFYGEKKIRIDVARAIIEFFPDSKEEYSLLRSQIINSLDDSILIDSPLYRPSAKIIFLSEDEQFRKNTFNEIDNALTDIKQHFSNLSVDKNDYKKLFFSFDFKDSEERDMIKSKLESVSKRFYTLSQLKYNNDLGSTSFSLFEDQKLREELEKNLQRDFGRESVNLINGTEYDNLNDSIELELDENDPFITSKYNWELRKKQREYLPATETIGSCISRTPDKISIQLNEELIDDILDGTIKIRKGDYVQFPVVGKSSELFRQKEAMDRIMNPGKKFGKKTIQSPANTSLPNFMFDPRYATETNLDVEEEKEKIKKNRIEPYLNEKQLEAVTKAVLAQDLALIQGPPGTGKTTVIAEIIWQEVLRNPKCKILLTSQTNLAVDNALERLQGKRGIRPIRVVSKASTDKLEREGLRYLVSVIDDWSSESNDRNNDNAANLWVNTIIEGVSKEDKYSEIIKAWKKDLTTKDDFIRQKFADAYKQNVNLVAATCSVCGSKDFTDTFKSLYNETELAFDVVIMDEASKATPLEMAVPLVWGRKIIVIGDHKQLPPVMDENSFDTALRKIGRDDLAEKIENIKESQFKRLFQSSAKVRTSIVATLDTQYRMHEKMHEYN
ncbi:MAG: AAA domain-containing protein [Paludibacteraceae bacterium]